MLYKDKKGRVYNDDELNELTEEEIEEKEIIVYFEEEGLE